MARYVLRIVGGTGPGQEIELTGPLEVGRDPDADVSLAEDRLVSSRHARVTPREEGVVVEDLGSRNGTFADGVRIAGPTLVRPGGEILVGDTTIRLADLPAPEYLLTIVEPGGEPRDVRLSGPLEVGRDPDAGLTLPRDHLVSRLHASLTPLVGGVAVDDLGSRNGTFVDGVPIDEATLVRPGEEIRIGETTLHVKEAPAQEFVLKVVGQGTTREVRLAGPLEVGRDPSAGLALDQDHLVSRSHARLTPEGVGIRVEDLGSRNGTYVNGAVVRSPTRVLPGDKIVVGGTVLTLRRSDGLRAGETAVRTAVGPLPGQLTSPGGEPELTYEETAEPVPEVGGSGRRQVWTFIACAMALFMAVLDNLVVTFALPSIQADLDATVQQLEWTVNAFTLAFAVFLLPAATLGDRFGRRRVFTLGIALFTAASVACALAPSIEVFLIARVAQGLGGAMIMPLSLTILSDAFPAEKRGLVLGAWSGIAGLAVSLGPVVGGALVTGISWHWIFWLNVPTGVALLPVCVLRLRESFGPSERVDAPGIVLAGAGLFGVVFGVVRGNAAGWTSIEVVVPLAVGVALLVGFVAWELRTPTPMLPMHLFKSRTFSAANAASFLMYFGLFGSIFLLSQFLQVAQGYTALEAGLRALPWTAMPILISPLAGILSERIGGRPLMTVGLTFQAASLGWLALILEPDVGYLKLIPPFIVGGIGMGLFFAPVAHEILGAVKLEQEGKASGTNNTIREIGGAFGIAVLVTIFSSYGSFRSPQDFVDGLIPAVTVGAAVLLVGALTAFAIERKRPLEEVSSMSSAVPALGGFTPGVTLVRPALRRADADSSAQRT